MDQIDLRAEAALPFIENVLDHHIRLRLRPVQKRQGCHWRRLLLRPEYDVRMEFTMGRVSVSFERGCPGFDHSDARADGGEGGCKRSACNAGPYDADVSPPGQEPLPGDDRYECKRA